MTHEELIKEILQLPPEERAEVLEAIKRSLQEEMRLQERRRDAVRRLRGIAKPEGPPPSDEEIKDEYTRYLMEKYS
jgi:hypothetical protein